MARWSTADRLAARARFGWLLPGLAYQIWVAVTGHTGGPDRHFVDLDIYLRSAQHLRDGTGLYCFPSASAALSTCPTYGFTYPPIAIALFLPLTVLPRVVARILWTAATLTLASCTLVRVFRVALPPGSRWVGPAAGAVLFSEPLRENVLQGQLSVAISCLLVLGLIGTDRGGGWLGVGAALKVSPALAVAALAAGWPASRRRALAALLAASALTVAGAVAWPRETWQYVTDVGWDVHRIGTLGSASNASVQGLAAHLHLLDAVSRAVTVATVIGVLAGLVLAGRRTDWSDPRDRAVCALLAGIGICMVTPITWTHHCLLVVVAGLWLAAGGYGRLAPDRRTRLVWLGLVLLPAWYVQVMRIAAEQADSWLGRVLVSVRFASLVILFAVLLADLARGGGSGPRTWWRRPTGTGPGRRPAR